MDVLMLFRQWQYSRSMIGDKIWIRRQKRPLGIFFLAQELHYLNYSFGEFERMPIHVRLLWLKAFIEQAELPSGKRWFNNIVGILEAFVKYRLAHSGSWLSIVDASILQAIQDGYQLYRMEISHSDNPGGTMWALFFQALAMEVPLPELFQLWSEAEIEATEYGRMVAHLRGLRPTLFERLFLKMGDLYRSGIIHAAVIGRWAALLGALIGSFYGLMVMLFEARNWESGSKKILLYRQLGFIAGQLFVDPRYRYKGYSLVYWGSNYFWYYCVWISETSTLRQRWQKRQAVAGKKIIRNRFKG